MHHNVHLVLRVAWVDCVGEATIVIVPLHLQGTTGVVLGVLVWRPRLCCPSMRVEVALRRAIEGRELRVLATVVILDILETLSKVLVMVRTSCISLKDHVREESGQLTFANLS